MSGRSDTYPMNSFDMVKADSNTERSQYKHSKLKTMRAIQRGSKQAVDGSGEVLKETRAERARGSHGGSRASDR